MRSAYAHRFVGLWLAGLCACSTDVAPLDEKVLRAFAQAYMEAWSSQDPERVAACFAESGSLTLNAPGHASDAQRSRRPLAGT